MNCPECGKPMIVLELDGVEFDHCPDCGGTWLDAGELEWIAGLAGVQPGEVTAKLESPELPKGMRARRLLTWREKRKCPRCRAKLNVVQFAGDPPVEVDRCFHGHGFWFDRGELRAVIEAFAGRAEPDETGAIARTLGDFFRNEFNPLEKGA